ncbi:MAG TPA: DUF5591 domain-containing protein [Thermoplasmata archaeon]|nr:DUF5591 domain-containing protein [Thermoplasmata archaeon]
MTRVLEALDGLALLGSARIGPLAVPTPGLLESRWPGSGGSGISLGLDEAPSGSRRIVLDHGASHLELTVPIGAPEILGGDGSLVPIGDGAYLVRGPLPRASGASAAPGRPSLLVLANARALWAEGRPFVTAVGEIRRQFGAAPVVWAPRVALPHRVALLAYLGVDLVDTTEGLLEAARGVYLDPALGRLDPDAVRAEHPCACPGCTGGGPTALELHAEAACRAAVAEARVAGRAGRLRELAEARLPSEPALAELLRYADRDLADLLEERSPVADPRPRAYVIAEAHRRPEMVRFRARFLARYRPPPSKRVLLLVPCSKRKPYRVSRSHRRFAAALEGLAHRERLHVVSVSSPIGLVPRELEDVPPARQYDIPVTGDWTLDEQRTVREGLDHLLAHGAYRSAVVHLDPAEFGFLADRFGSLPVRWTEATGSSTAPDALARLREAVAAALEAETPVAGGPLAVVREELAAVAAVQFGAEGARRLFRDPVRLLGRPWFQRVTDGHDDLATLREERGLFQLTVAGARRFGVDPPLAVSIEPTLALSGDLFCPGVRGADPAIRAGDAVVLVRGGHLAGVGEAALPGPLMTQLGHGIAVRVRHRVGAPSTDTPMTGDGSRSTEGPVV